MMQVEVRRQIAAPAAAVWQVLTDAQRLAGAGLGILRIDGRIAEGQKISLWSEVAPKRAFRLTVRDVVADRSMVWTGGMPLGLFTGRRVFTLTPQPTGTDFHMVERFSGVMSGLITRSMPDLQPSFDRFADGVKALAERTEA